MKTLLTLITTTALMFVGLYVEAENNTKTDLKKLVASRENLNKKKCIQQKVDYYRKTADKYKNAQLSKCDQNREGAIKDAAEKIVKLKKELAPTFEALAEANKKSDKQAVKKLTDQKHELQSNLRIAEKGKSFLYTLDSLEKASKKYPDSPELKSLHTTAKANAAEHIKLLKEKAKIDSKCRALDNKSRHLHKLIEIAKQKAKLNASSKKK